MKVRYVLMECFDVCPCCTCRWSEVTRQLELWVQLMELNEAGEFTAVEVLPAKDVRTGGIFQLRQVSWSSGFFIRIGAFLYYYTDYVNSHINGE